MTGLLHRLIGQAAQTTNGTRIRAAASVHAPAPIARAAAERAPPAPPAFPETGTRPPAALGEQSPHEGRLQRDAGTPATRATSVGTPAPVFAAAWAATPTTLATAPASPRATESVIDLPASLPTPLLPAAPSAAPVMDITPRHAPPQVILPTREDAQSQPTEVHVHIGRIEVRASQEPAPSKPRQTSRPTVALSDYLARRSSP